MLSPGTTQSKYTFNSTVGIIGRQVSGNCAIGQGHWLAKTSDVTRYASHLTIKVNVSVCDVTSRLCTDCSPSHMIDVKGAGLSNCFLHFNFRMRLKELSTIIIAR